MTNLTKPDLAKAREMYATSQADDAVQGSDFVDSVTYYGQVTLSRWGQRIWDGAYEHACQCWDERLAELQTQYAAAEGDRQDRLDAAFPTGADDEDLDAALSIVFDAAMEKEAAP